MQELEFVPDDSDAASLVLRDTESDRLYWIPVTEALRDHVTVARELAAEENGAGEDAPAATVTPAASDIRTAPGPPQNPPPPPETPARPRPCRSPLSSVLPRNRSRR
jgi:hypothetical protein